MSRAWPCVRIAIGGGAITETVARMRTRGSPSKRMDTIVRVRPRIARLSGEPERATLFGLLIPLANKTSTEWRLRNPGIKGARGTRERLSGIGAFGASPEKRMADIVECVPNFSEGRRKEVVDAIAKSIASVPGVRLLDTEMDPDHNRCVITFVGDRNAVAEAAFQGAKSAVARPVLIAWNVNLGTKDVTVAKRIAKAIRESDGGLPAVRAKGFELADRGLVQVSMNMTDYRKTSLVQAFEAIRELATKEHVEIVESEIIGLVPLDAVLVGATQYFKLARFHREQVLEARLWE